MPLTRQAREHRSTVRTRDLDEAQAILSRAYLALRLFASDRQPEVDTRFTGIAIGRATVGALSFGTGMRLVTAGLENFHVNLPAVGRSASLPGTKNEIITEPGRAQVFVPDESTDQHWSSNASLVCVMLDRVSTERQLAALLGHELSAPLVFEPVMDLRAVETRGWADVLQLINHEMRRDTGLLSHDITRMTLERLLMEALLTGQRHNYSEALAAAVATPAPNAVQVAVDLLHDHPEYPWTAGELARRVGVSVRALHGGFRARMDMGPMSYVRTVRLDRVRDELSQGRPGATVATVARRWGFAHLGRFAASYDQRFGELPSQTLLGHTVTADPLSLQAHGVAD